MLLIWRSKFSGDFVPPTEPEKRASPVKTMPTLGKMRLRATGVCPEVSTV